MNRNPSPSSVPAEFNHTVWEIVRQIPPGKVATYGQIASLIPPPKGMDLGQYAAFRSRWVGGAMARCPEDVPWHRVVNAQGKVSLSNPEHQAKQVELLAAEGIIFDQRQRIDLEHYRWEGPQEG